MRLASQQQQEHVILHTEWILRDFLMTRTLIVCLWTPNQGFESGLVSAIEVLLFEYTTYQRTTNFQKASLAGVLILRACPPSLSRRSPHQPFIKFVCDHQQTMMMIRARGPKVLIEPSNNGETNNSATCLKPCCATRERCKLYI